MLFSLVLMVSATAQPGPPPPDAGQPVPVTGIEYLLAAGAFWGGRQFLKKKKQTG